MKKLDRKTEELLTAMQTADDLTREAIKSKNKGMKKICIEKSEALFDESLIKKK